MSRLIVKNLPKQTTEKMLRELFGQKGTVTDCSLKYKDGKFRGFAFIGFTTEEETQAAQKYFDKTYVNTSRILVEFAVELGSEKPRAWSKQSTKWSLQKVKNEMQPEVKQTKEKGNKDEVLLGELNHDPDFKEYMAVYTSQRHKSWGNDTGNAAVVDDEPDEVPEEQTVADDVNNTEEGKHKKSKDKSKTMSDLDFLKSKMVDSAALSSDDEDEDVAEDEKAGLKKKKRQIESSNTAEGKSSQEKKMEGENLIPKKKFCIKMKGLPATIKESAIREFFKPLKVLVKMPKNKKNLSIGIAFVQCRSEQELQMALAKNKNFIDRRPFPDRLLRHWVITELYSAAKSGKKKVFLNQVFEEVPVVTSVDEKPRPWEGKAKKISEGEESIIESGSLFVRNLAYQCTEEVLEPLFSKYGPLTDFDLPVDSVTKRNKGFAHITYMMPEHAVKAFTELDGKAFMGRMLHILPGIERDEKYRSSEKSSFKKQKDEQVKALAKSSHNWNTLFLGSNAIATAMATKYKTSKDHILDDSGKGSLGVRMALGETQLVQETRQFLIENGVALDSFSQADGPRSKTVIIAKDLPAGTQENELQEMFSKYGTVARVLLPPHGITALVEFQEPSEARRAFSHLAYRKFKYLPLYLEWAPMAIFNKNTVQTELSEGQQVETVSEKAGVKENTAPFEEPSAKNKAEVQPEDEGTAEPGSTVFVKNLNFSTQEAALQELFSRAGDVQQVTIAKKKDMKNPGKFLSMGYGFVEFKKAASAVEALKTLQKQELDGHTLELKISHRELLQSKSSRKEQSGVQKESTKILVRNIPFQSNRKEIEELFKVFGELKYVRVPKKASGPGVQGFAFVDFLTKQDAKRAFDALCHSTHLYGRRLVLEWANTEESVEDLQRKTAQKFHDGGPAKKLRKNAIMESLS